MEPGLPDFSWFNVPKLEKMDKITVQYIKFPQIVPTSRKTEQIAIKYTNIFHCKTPQNLPKLGFLVLKIPSGNPELNPTK
jgi:hypothetical protein